MESDKDYAKKDISVAQRQVFILSLLSDNPLGFTADEITDRLNNWGAGVLKRTVTRDIDELSTSYAIIEESRQNKTYYKANKFNMKNVDLTGLDMLSISFLEKLLIPYENYSMGKNAKMILDKITMNTGKLNRELISKLGEQLVIADDAPSDDVIDTKIEAIIKAAIEKKNVVEVDYINWKTKEITKRIIHPLSFKIIDKRLSVEAYCEMRNALRTFRMSRIKRAAVLSRTFEVPDGYEGNTGNEFIYLNGDNAQEIRIRFKGEAATFIKEYKKGMADMIKKDGDDIIFIKNAAVTPEVVRFVLSYGADAQVLSPNELKDEVKGQILAMYDEYKDK